jgi:glycosyltransferase involved in cell wall biosynthesis
MKRRITRAVVFWQYMTHYRLGVCRELQRDENIQVTFCARDRHAGNFMLTDLPDKRFPFLDVGFWQWRVPFTHRHLYFQPYAVWSMVTGRFDVFIMGNTFLNLHVWIDLILARLRRRRVCLWGHGDSIPPTRTSRFLRRIIMRWAHAVIFYTEGDRNRWIQAGLPPNKLFVAYNALDNREADAIRNELSPQDLAAFRKAHGLDGKKVVIYIGRLLDYKKPQVLIQAMKRVVEDVPQAHLVMIGAGPLRAELDTLVRTLDLADHVTLTGPVPDERTVAQYHLCARVGVMPASAGLSIQHAFGYGVPMIVGDDRDRHPPEVELVEEGVTGLYARDGDPEDFARAIRRLLTADDERDRMAANARRVIEEKYNIRQMAGGLLDAIRYCANGPRNAHPNRRQ